MKHLLRSVLPHASPTTKLLFVQYTPSMREVPHGFSRKPADPIYCTHSIANVSLPDPGGFFLRASAVGNGGYLRYSLLLNIGHPFRLQPRILLGCLLGVLNIILWDKKMGERYAVEFNTRNRTPMLGFNIQSLTKLREA